MLRVVSAQSLLELAERGQGELALGARREYSLLGTYGSTGSSLGDLQKPVKESKRYLGGGSLSSLRSRFWALIETDIARAGGHATSRTGVLRERLDAVVSRCGDRSRPAGEATTTTGVGKASDVAIVREVFAEMMALQELNSIALRKAVKKYDKTCTALGFDASLRDFMARLRYEPLVLTAKRLTELEAMIASDLVSRDKLLQWRIEANEKGAANFLLSLQRRGQHPRRGLFFVEDDDDRCGKCPSFIGWALCRWTWRPSSSTSGGGGGGDDDYLYDAHLRGGYPRQEHLTSLILSMVSQRMWLVSLAVLVFAGLLMVPCFPADPVASRAAAVVAVILLLWTTQAIPYHATALLAPALVVLTRVLREPHGTDPPVLSAEDAATKVIEVFFSGSTWLLLGGYAMSAALARCELEVAAANALRSRLGDAPRAFLLAVMVMGCTISAVLSNSTSAVLCVAVLEPCLTSLDETSAFARALLLGLALACNVGGMLSPIASMQNIISVQALAPVGVAVGFGDWIFYAAPVAYASVVATWGVIAFGPVGFVGLGVDVPAVPGPAKDTAFFWEQPHATFAYLDNSTHHPRRPDDDDQRSYDGDETLHAVPLTSPGEKSLTIRKRKLLHWVAGLPDAAPWNTVAVSLVSLVTVVLWSVSGPPSLFGNVAVVSFAYMSLALGHGFLTAVDLNSLPWHTLILLGGSNVLGLAVQSSRLLDYVAAKLIPYLPDGVRAPTQLLVVIVIFVSLVSTFVSHTVASIIVMPLVSKVAADAGHPAEIGLAAALAISSSAALPFSSLPNLNSLTRLDKQRRPYLHPHHFLSYGAIAQLITASLIVAWSPLGTALFIHTTPILDDDDHNYQ